MGDNVTLYFNQKFGFPDRDTYRRDSGLEFVGDPTNCPFCGHKHPDDPEHCDEYDPELGDACFVRNIKALKSQRKRLKIPT